MARLKALGAERPSFIRDKRIVELLSYLVVVRRQIVVTLFSHIKINMSALLKISRGYYSSCADVKVILAKMLLE